VVEVDVEAEEVCHPVVLVDVEAEEVDVAAEEDGEWQLNASGY
jgi:hypothetical protein